MVRPKFKATGFKATTIRGPLGKSKRVNSGVAVKVVGGNVGAAMRKLWGKKRKR
jgi:hypothetical protein